MAEASGVTKKASTPPDRDLKYAFGSMLVDSVERKDSKVDTLQV